MNDKKNITVIGATGKIGRELIYFLSKAEIPTIAVTRNKSKATALPFIEWIEADLSDKQSLVKTIEKSKAVFLASSINQHFVTEQNNVIETAKEYGVKHIVKISSPGADKNSTNFIVRPNGEVDELLKASGIPCTVLQPNAFMQNWLGEFSNLVKNERKIIEASGEGKKPFLDTRDIAEVAFNILAAPEDHINKTYLLTGGEAVNYKQVAEAIGKVIGEPVQFVSISLDQARQRMEQKGMPPMMISTFLAIAEGQKNGKADFVNTTVQELLGKKPITVEQFVKDNIMWFK